MYSYKKFIQRLFLFTITLGIILLKGEYVGWLFQSFDRVNSGIHKIPIVDNSRKDIDFFLNQIAKKDSVTALFAPDDPINQLLVYLIDNEQTKIDIAIFTFTDSLMSDALVRARQRGVMIEIVGDKATIIDQYNKFDRLYESGVDLYCYNPQWAGRKRNSIMHHKFIIFYDTMNHFRFILTGSFNFTKAAREVNQENIVIIKRQEVVGQFEKQFNLLKQRSYRYRPCFTTS